MYRTKINWLAIPFLLLLALILMACGNQAPAPAADVASSDTLNLPVDVDTATVEQVRNRDDVTLIDVREDWEYAEGHIPGAVLIPLGQIPDRLDEIPQDKTVIAVCRSGNRSNQATNLLRQQGFDNIHNMQGGMIAWSQAGYEIEK
ncbi:rhodanese-like domain-containing protein [Chloroflexota bacterium]